MRAGVIHPDRPARCPEPPGAENDDVRGARYPERGPLEHRVPRSGAWCPKQWKEHVRYGGEMRHRRAGITSLRLAPITGVSQDTKGRREMVVVVVDDLVSDHDGAHLYARRIGRRSLELRRGPARRHC
jgi:hypothetical protein